MDDLVGWLWATWTVVREALTELDAVAVAIDGGGTGWIPPDDLSTFELMDVVGVI